MKRFWSWGSLAAMITGTVLLAFPMMALAQPDYSDYEGSEWCADCHEENYSKWQASGHPYKLMKVEQARNRPIPVPVGTSWDDYTYVIGGYKWKSRYLDDEGYIYTPADGQNQYNYLTGQWSDYHAGETKPYDCGRCHTTAWIPDEDPDSDGDLTDNQDGLPGIHGTFAFGGIHCEQCHGPGNDMNVDDSAAFCGTCHIRDEADTIPASGGFIRHHEQYNEHLAGPHANFDCVRCHDPHSRGEFSINEDAQCGVSCHSGIGDSYAETTMADYGVECKDCHMSYATKSAQALGPHQGDLQTHIFYINTDPAGNMFTEDGGFVALDGNGKGAVTMDFACQRCHETAELSELAKFAKDFHDTDKGLEDIGLDPGLTGTWYDAARAGEGWLLEVGYAGGAMYMFASFYTYDALGSQAYLLAESTAITGNMAEMTVYMTEGAMWGEDFNSGDVMRPLWGTAKFTFPTCGTGTVELMANDDMKALGFSDMTTQLTRLLESGTSCPTFVNNAP